MYLRREGDASEEGERELEGPASRKERNKHAHNIIKMYKYHRDYIPHAGEEDDGKEK